ncbi:MAG TPA: hypothetical protein VNA16_06790, partial [Abditibacteriaceae bacterium]|nr:hypothetical protein [Abditibacteriaceae bacterium]
RPSGDAAQKLGRVPGVLNARREGEAAGKHNEQSLFALDIKPGVDAREAVARLVVNEGWGLLELSRRRASLEDVFIELTTSDEQEAQV